MAILEFIYDLNGRSQALDFIDNIYQRGKTDQVYADISYYVDLIMEHLEIEGIPPNPEKYPFTFRDRNKPWKITTRHIYKELRHHVPLIELRYNHYLEDKQCWPFRMIFFTYNYEGEQVIFITRALIKKGKSDSLFNRYCTISDKIYQDFLKNPLRYLEGEEE